MYAAIGIEKPLTPRVFLTGMPGVGKSTVVKRVTEKMRGEGLKVGGMVTAEIRSGTTRVGFEIRDLLAGRVGMLAHANQAAGPKIGKYRVNSHDLEEIGAQAILSAITDSDLIVIDEVGPMELTSTRFKEAVQAALECGKPILGTVHRNAQDPIVKIIKSEAGIDVVEVTHANREELPITLVDRFRATRQQDLQRKVS
jgi:nucleoside-triphosphatase